MSTKDFKLGRGGIPDQELSDNTMRELGRLLDFITKNPGEMSPDEVMSRLEVMKSDLEKLDSQPHLSIKSKNE